MMFPKAQTACSHTFMLEEDKSAKKCGTAPAFTTAWVCSLVPLAILVKAQAASNWRVALNGQIL